MFIIVYGRLLPSAMSPMSLPSEGLGEFATLYILGSQALIFVYNRPVYDSKYKISSWPSQNHISRQHYFTFFDCFPNFWDKLTSLL